MRSQPSGAIALGRKFYIPRGSIYTTIRELGLKYHTIEGIMGPNSLMVVYVDPLGLLGTLNYSHSKDLGHLRRSRTSSFNRCPYKK